MKDRAQVTFATPDVLRKRIIACKRCPRLVRFREGVEARPSFSSQRYWRRPVAGFGDLGGRLLVLGIAPAAHGGNRTGRPFTGDKSGDFLVRALHATGFANQPVSTDREDGLVYTDCYLTAAVKCAPPGDRPTMTEFARCSEYLDGEIGLMKNLRAVLVLGGLSMKAFKDYLAREGAKLPGLKFRHGAEYDLGGLRLYASYHPSPRNTNTGKLTDEMLVSVLRRIKSGIRIGKSSKDN